MSRGQDAVIAVREERARIGGIEAVKKTVVAATDEGVIAFEINTLEVAGSGYGNNNPMAALPSYPQQTALPPPSRIVIADPPERDCSDYCCACDGGYEWYELKGKGICWVLLLLLFYLLVGVILLPFVILCCVCACFTSDKD